ncbi:Vesicle-associated membrane protein, putative [Perkinsus marinus ATCC 50983]|uniref:Vesicle-associated membrane protein, putative n=1 Tax=Perkinsus marinus (strain ATCC 50983 / TXsc) TaxID=423536 RepID=C5KC70_PERM5|nr:Vesicle-associated membrane protein, putative [Perkinsus marinus ATCC 50983]EER17883.1 Vesicle-associated membrane protein, putative [Perkinsus marinus ATCC 50983]|eukprot:XP_002786087.1 Vesicle-associated membrane protein, putative [Perkinsus marinus ATCC 50983]
MADERMGRQRPFRFLEDLKNKFEEQFNYAVVKAATPLQLNGEMQHSVLATLMEFHNSPEADTITRVRAHIGNIHDNMVENIDNIIKRQEKIELLVEKTDDLNRTATIFRREARLKT